MRVVFQFVDESPQLIEAQIEKTSEIGILSKESPAQGEGEEINQEL